jgi:thiol-disulfide isomerase/thioredoxin
MATLYVNTSVVKIIPLFLVLLAGSQARCQLDSTWLASNILPKYYIDTGTNLPHATFINEQGEEKTLADLKGKILYVDIWATWCANCMNKFPYQEQLMQRLKILHLDTAIQFVNISIEDSRKEWKKAVKKYDPPGLNLYCSDTSLYEKWNIAALPAYILLDASGKVLGKDIANPQDAMIDFILYASTKGIKPVKAVWTEFRQGQLLSVHRTPAAFTDKDYATWYSAMMPSLVAFYHWREEQEKKKSFKK